MRALWIGCLAACGAGSQAAGYDNASWTDHMQAAAQHDARAVEHEREARIAAADSGPASYSCGDPCLALVLEDRKSTRLNSSHQIISYAVFCLKKKKKPTTTAA